MLPRNALPDDVANWAAVTVELDRLVPDTPEGCPRERAEIVEYVRRESADLDESDPTRLVFVRTAKLDGAQAWIWDYTEADGERTYVTVHLAESGVSTLGLASPNGLNHEQFLLAEYYGEVDWS